MSPRIKVFLAIAVPAAILIPINYAVCKARSRTEQPFDYYFYWAAFSLGCLACSLLLLFVIFWPKFFNL